ncbi:MAG: hypothetical protein WEB60_11440 [Terrimicrobiaceae bacterium]
MRRGSAARGFPIALGDHKNVAPNRASWYCHEFMKFTLLPVLLCLAGLPGCITIDELLSDSDEMPVIYVRDAREPIFYDPYYNRLKIYQAPVVYESKTKKTKGNRVYETTTIRNQFGDVVYKDTSSRKKKKKKK